MSDLPVNTDTPLGADTPLEAAPLLVKPHRGTLNMRIGPMFSGKTTWLNGELTQLADKGFSVLKIIHSDDTRAETIKDGVRSGSTHNSSYRFLSEKISITRTNRLSDVNVDEFHVIGIDESQFFQDLTTMVENWVEIKSKHVRLVGLDGDAFKRKFGQTLDLIPMCDEVIKLNASCRICLDELDRMQYQGNIMSIMGPFTKRRTSCSNPPLSQKDVGGAEKYIPVCRFHYSN